MVIVGSKRGVTFNENVTVNQPTDADKKYSLDSDEEEEVRKVGKLDVDQDIEGVEETTMRNDGDQKITPFNLNDEEEEGYFDESGTFIFDKEKGEIRDSWLDTLDMAKIKEIKVPDFNKESTPDPLDSVSSTDMLREVVSILQPKETVKRALQRLGGSQLSASQRLKLKKKGQTIPERSEEDKKAMDRLTVLSDYLLHKGRDTILQDTREKLNFEVTQASQDIFADAEQAGSSRKRQRVDESTQNSVTTELNWYYKVGDCAGLQGPISSSEMFRMQQEGTFKPGTKVCKEDSKDKFYDAKRIQFDDYID